jgi:hypothetical protein
VVEAFTAVLPFRIELRAWFNLSTWGKFNKMSKLVEKLPTQMIKHKQIRKLNKRE